jgi:DNA-directed RNA polymerase specialized sigma24 family protein
VAARFPTTHWSRICRLGERADPEARAALEELCRDYWFPLYAFIRARGHESHAAEDLVQGFLADLLERGDLARLDQSRGRFRSFLRAACDHYLANRREHDQAAKRGGDLKIVPIDRLDAESRYSREPAHELTAERLFEREWALALLGRVLARLEAESIGEGKGRLFERLRPALQGDGLAPSYRAIGDELDLSEGAVRTAAHRVRLRYRALLREEVGRTTGDRDAVDDEISELLAALAAG